MQIVANINTLQGLTVSRANYLSFDQINHLGPCNQCFPWRRSEDSLTAGLGVDHKTFSLSTHCFCERPILISPFWKTCMLIRRRTSAKSWHKSWHKTSAYEIRTFQYGYQSSVKFTHTRVRHISKKSWRSFSRVYQFSIQHPVYSIG